jgi:hypothetical protein
LIADGHYADFRWRFLRVFADAISLLAIAIAFADAAFAAIISAFAARPFHLRRLRHAVTRADADFATLMPLSPPFRHAAAFIMMLMMLLPVAATIIAMPLFSRFFRCSLLMPLLPLRHY